MKRLFRLIFLILITVSTSHASIGSFGHNLSHTNYTLDKNDCSVGFQVIGCGFNDMFFGTSPFLYAFYNMHNFYYRYSLKNKSPYTNSFELAYFKTFNDDKRPTVSDDLFDQIYKMEAAWLYYILSINVAANYKLHINTILNYYLDDERPFSLRRPTIKRDKHQLNISTLHEIKLSKSFGMLAELGVLHVLDEYPRVHMGSSFVYKNGGISAHLGFSFSTTISGLVIESDNPIRRDLQQFLIFQPDGFNSEYATKEALIKQDFAIHPEMSLQYEF